MRKNEKVNQIGNAQFLCEVIGKEAAARLMQCKGLAGCAIEFSKSRASRIYEQLAEEIGIEAADKLIAVLGGDRFYIPNEAAAQRLSRNRRIVSGYCQGSTVKELAAFYALSDRQIWTILKSTDMGDGSFAPKIAANAMQP